MEYQYLNKTMTLFLEGRITSANADSTRDDIHAILNGKDVEKVVLDAGKLEYISSAGLRIVFALKRDYADLSIVNVSLDVFDIFEMTGFTKILKVYRKLAEIDVTGMQVIGEGRTGIVYRMNKDTILKVYKRDVSIGDIEAEMKLSRESFVLGIPTAITFDIVKVGTRLASRFEMLDCDTFAEVIAKDVAHLDNYLDQYAELLRKINSTSSSDLDLPDKKKKWIQHAELCLPHLDDAHGKKLMDLIQAVPERKTFVHGDCHIKNIMSDGKSLFLIDMGALSTGHPIFELASIYNAYVGFGLVDPEVLTAFLGIPAETCAAFWRRSLELYLDTADEDRLNEVEAKAKIIGLTRLMRREIRRGGLSREDGRKLIEACRSALAELLPGTDSLVF